MNEEFPRREFDLKSLRRWKLVQIAAVLPLTLTVVLIIYWSRLINYF